MSGPFFCEPAQKIKHQVNPKCLFDHTQQKCTWDVSYGPLLKRKNSSLTPSGFETPDGTRLTQVHLAKRPLRSAEAEQRVLGEGLLKIEIPPS